MTTRRDDEIAGFLAGTAWEKARRTRIAGDASPRKYDRLELRSGATAILMDAPAETHESVTAFVQIADHLRHHGLSTPRILHQSAAKGLLVIEDLGDALFARIMAQDPSQCGPLYQAAMDVLVHLRDIPPLPLMRCDAPWMVQMVVPLFDWYAPKIRENQRSAFETLFYPLATQAVSGDAVMMLRDYHAENLLLLPERPGVARVGILDFQDAMLAPAAYDVVSVLQDARRDVDAATERDALNTYLSRTGDDAEDFEARYAILGVQRNLRIIGIFARLCLQDGKPHYIDMIPRVWSYVVRNLNHPALAELNTWFHQTLPAPSPAYLQELRSRCPSLAIPS